VTDSVEQRQADHIHALCSAIGHLPGNENLVITALRAPGSDRPPGMAGITIQSVQRFERPNRDTATRRDRWTSLRTILEVLITIYIGIDWSEAKNDIVFLNEAGTVITQILIPHSLEGLNSSGSNPSGHAAAVDTKTSAAEVFFSALGTARFSGCCENFCGGSLCLRLRYCTLLWLAWKASR